MSLTANELRDLANKANDEGRYAEADALWVQAQKVADESLKVDASGRRYLPEPDGQYHDGEY